MHRARIVALAASLIVGVGCGEERPQPPVAPRSAVFPLTVTDDDGVEMTIPEPPKRIVTFAPSNTEIAFALGAGDRLVGVSGAFDDHPPEAKAIEHVGGAGEFGVDPNVEKVVSLQPDLVLAIAGGEHWKERLRELGISVFTLNATDFRDLLGDISALGRIVGADARARRLTADMAADAHRIEGAVGAERSASCFFEVFFPPLTTVGPGTFIFDLLERAGCDPVSAGASADYPEWSVDRLVQEDPDAYLVSSESGHSPEAVGGRPGFSALSAVEDGRVHLIDSDLVSRPGPRVVQGLRELAEALHPDAL